MSRKPGKSARRTEIKGDVNIRDGDLVAGDKSISHRDDELEQGVLESTRTQHVRRVKSREIQGNLDVSGGDVVLGDKIIKFFQDNLNIYIFRDSKQLALFLAFLLLLSGALAGAYWYSRQPKLMTGNYNVAIAQFGEIQADGSIKPSGTAEQISNDLFNFLDSEYQASGLGLDVEVAHKNMPLILENSQARELAQKIHADIVIYGNVAVRNDEAQFSPRFFVAEHPDTQELTGQDELAHPILFSVAGLNARDSLNSQLRSRTEILFNFTRALIHLSQDDLDSALRAIWTSISAAEKLNQSFAGQEVLYLVAAKVYLNQNEFDRASQMFDKASALNPNYARAHLGRGNMYYVQATLSGQYDPSLMDNARTEYELALDAPDQPEGAYIPIKGHTALGSVYVIMAQANANDPDLFAKGIDHYTYVIDAYQRTGDPFLQSYTAIAYFGIGAAYERQNEKEQAIEAYLQAYDLGDSESFKERISKQIENLRLP